MNLDLVTNAIARVLPDLNARMTVTESYQTAPRIWIDTPADRIVDVVRAMGDVQPPYLSVISGEDAGETLVLNYHFTMGDQDSRGELIITLRVRLPKTDLVVPSLTSVLPGIMTAEREAVEFWGVTFDGLSDRRHIFLPSDFPTDVHPWRKDEKGLKGDDE